MNSPLGHGLSRLASAAAVAVIAAGAHAGGGGPELQVGWTVDGVFDSSSLFGTSLGGGTYSYNASTVGDTFEINWSFLVTDNGADGGFEVLSATLGITNTGQGVSTFGLDILLPVDLGPGMALYGGSMSASLTGGALGGYVSTVDKSPMFTALVDGEYLASLFDAPTGAITKPFASVDLPSQSFGGPSIPSLEHEAARESMAIDLNFELGSGSTFAITSTFVAQVPAPAGLALLGVAGLSRRRRRH